MPSETLKWTLRMGDMVALVQPMCNTLWWRASPAPSVPAMRSYYALRVCPRADTPVWWAAARRGALGAPPAVRAILAGRTRVEVGAAEAAEAIAWASDLEGWDSDGPTPLWVYPALPLDAGSIT